MAPATRPDARSPRFRWSPFARDAVFDPGAATASCIATPHMLPSLHPTSSARAVFPISRLNVAPHTIAVYASPAASPPPTQHSLPGGRYPLPGPDFHRLDTASFPGALDVLIIGAGASGAAAAWSLAGTRMHILCLEQGGWMNPATEATDSNRAPPTCLWSKEFYETDLSRGFVRGYTFQFGRGVGPIAEAVASEAKGLLPWGAGHHAASVASMVIAWAYRRSAKTCRRSTTA